MSTAGLATARANNFLALEPLLADLLRQALQGMRPAVQVLTAADLADVKLTRQHTPAVHLVYGGYRIEDDAGARLLLAHTWHAVTVVRNVASARTGQDARQDAGPLLERVMSALLGAHLKGATHPLKLAQPPRPWHEAGTQFIPTTVVVKTVFHKT
ncbi:phage tail terminator protein [Ottowia cancrivicina]|uniref:DUF3168 domain-containing protein n=1 Tax=Ottowia cancrivicina TaxID=3040346 RepID=A0AAW6RL18_9BURK|nr:hypothetical protein [Ottowia sp. 10c7w1]MDG9699251.1 hypothetical protein [Ottowia sp. 10c7w1]